MSVMGRAAVVFLVVGLGGCVADEVLPDRYGPEPILVVQEAKKSSERQAEIVKAFAGDTAASGNYYAATLAGLNFVDEKCDHYLRGLYILKRRTDRTGRYIGLADKVTSTALRFGGVSAGTLDLVAQTFGFAANATSVASDSYLFAVDPSVVYGIVGKLQAEYRRDLDGRGVPSAPTAYMHIRNYLALCLPMTIEAKVSEKLSKSTAVASNGAAATVQAALRTAAPTFRPSASTGSATPIIVDLQ